MLQNVDIKAVVRGGNRLSAVPSDITVSNIAFDSREVGEGCLFVAQRGVHVDGHSYIASAIGLGAVAVLCEELPAELCPDTTYIVTPDSSLSLGIVADNYYGHPSSQLSLVGVTGTNGKTTTATLLHTMMRSAGFHAGLISTIVNKIDERELPTHHTTPDALQLNSLLRQMVDAGCRYCFMEVSSHAVVQHRIAGLTFAGGIFSNITHDHLDFHKTMAAYIAAKKGFFDALPATAFALTNKDDANGMVMVQNTKASVHTYSLDHPADFKCRIVESTFSGTLLDLDGCEVWTRLVGRFNAYNLTAIYATATLCGMEKAEALRLLSGLVPVDGRFQCIEHGGIAAIVDYAHTPDALQNVINTINGVRGGDKRLIVVVGCGGDRDRSKRPEMAAIAATGSDTLILTSDNPRTEDPEAILDEMEAGLSAEQRQQALRIADRRQAIRTAARLAKRGDIILIAGKGHETYQEINGVRHHFDDREEIQNELSSLKPF
ncbi:MAG: UDP-N-acetylmuramoyl-L-alanyl-D-glutamate--2,6-diaminopimelate ligase [Bacteroidales bacterium]|nr:UDP-N-acetylmuramoyl-L-alanyl-D-glutamate--2,6-diaminopimelate ligase [Bacteroidales bacterium]